jgi:hypothetical protein
VGDRLKIKLVRTDDYKLQAKDLSPSARIALYFVERAIRGSPDEPRGFDYQIFLIPELRNIAVTVVENGGLLVGYHRAGPASVSLDLVVDRRHAPGWYSRE